MTTRIILARHGETDWNRERRVQGHADIPLNATGRRQARDLLAELSSDALDAIYSSDLRRAKATALAVAEPRGLAVVVVPGLRERSFGTWEGLTDDEAIQQYPEATADWRTWGDGETQEEMAGRVLQTLQRIGVEHVGKSVLVVSHGGPMRAVLRHAGRDVDGSLPNCAIVRLVAEDGVLRRVD